jgi:uncharacterized protein (TIGR03067 family)
MIRWLAARLLLVPLFARADEPDPEPPASGSRQLDGEWELVARKIKGVERKARGITLIVARGKMTQKNTSRGRFRDLVWTIKVGPRKSPAHIDMIPATSGRANHAIYKVAGDQLSLSQAAADVNSRPKDFDSARQVLVYRRKRK